MKFATNLAPFGPASDPRVLAELAQEAEIAGWDGFFLWDHMNWDRWGPEIGDPWIGLAAAALATQRLRLGTMVTPLFRRRPTSLARQATSLQQLCQGRLVVGLGLGAPDPEESIYLGEPGLLTERARMTDEAIELLRLLWSGKPVAFRGQFYKVKSGGFQPTPPAPIPLWSAATYPFRPGPLSRAARCEGVVPISYQEEPLSPEALRCMLEAIGKPGLDVACGLWTGENPDTDAERVAAYREAGVTWWVEPLDPWRGSFESLRARLRQGPPGG
jgi:alkanesulfonate monooxygenase SsuD/methylene tetrahydromethanopterin reductase-like flavin-dependent oxidoreductase (luciferase family)